MKNVIKQLLKCVLAGILAFFCLNLFCVAYKQTGARISNESGATDYKWESGQLLSTMEEGFAWVVLDKYGFNNASPVIKKSPDILIMGSSHMEAYNISSDKNVGYLLNQYCPDLYTYNIGISGHTIYSCVSNLENAIATYNPKTIIIEFSNIKMNCESMEQVLDGVYPKEKVYGGAVKYISKYAPFAKKAITSFDSWRSMGKTEEKAMNDNTTANKYYQTILNSFLKKASDMCAKEKIQLVVLYNPVTAIDSDGEWVEVTDIGYLSAFSETCKELGILFIDMTDDYHRLYNEEYILAHGFINTAIGKGHLNEYGHKAIADRLLQELHLD